MIAAPSPLVAVEVAAAESAAIIDEIPMLACLAARARGESRFSGLAELRVKESDRLALLAEEPQRHRRRAPRSTATIWSSPGSDRPLAGRGRHRRRSSHRDGVCRARHPAAGQDRRRRSRLCRGVVSRLRPRAGRALSGAVVTAANRWSWPSTVPPPRANRRRRQRWPARAGMVHIDSGAWYRALTWLAVTRALADAGGHPARGARRRPGGNSGRRFAVAGGERATLDEELRRPDVTARVSGVAAQPDAAGLGQRAAAGRGRRRLVGRSSMAGISERWSSRDAALKVYLTASPVVRARRRLEQQGGEPLSPEEARSRSGAAQRARPARSDPRRSPRCAPADDAVVIDTGTTLVRRAGRPDRHA